jgi:putative ABC transport system permease protein
MRAASLAFSLLPSMIRRYMAALLLAALGVGVFAAILPLVGSGAASAAGSERGLGAPALRAIEIAGSSADAVGNDGPPLSREAIEDLTALDGVSAAYGWEQTTLSLQFTGDDFFTAGYVTRIPDMQPALLEGREPQASGEVIVSSSMLVGAGLAIGDTAVTMHNVMQPGGNVTGSEGGVTIVGSYDGAVAGLDGDDVVYGWTGDVTQRRAEEIGQNSQWMRENYTFAKAYVIASDMDGLPRVVEELRAEGHSATSFGTLLSEGSSLQKFLEGLRPLLMALLAAILVVIAWNTTSALVAARRVEVGMLRALGWTRGEISATFMIQMAVAGILVGAAGVVVSVVLLGVLNVVGSGGEIFGLPLTVSFGPTTLVAMAGVLFLPAIIFLVASIPPVLRLARLAPDVVLRDLRT